MMYKSTDDIFKHFKKRLNERYGIDILLHNYNELIKNKRFKGLMSKNSNNTLCEVTIKKTTIYCLYNNKYKMFTTCYPPIIGSNIEEMIVACFSRPLRMIAHNIYESIENEINSEKSDFENIQEAAIYYFNNSSYPTLLIDKYNFGRIRPIKYCQEIKKIIDGNHLRTKLCVIKRKITHNDPTTRI